MDIQSGEFIAFIGTSGSGKTTALRMINRMIEATDGQIMMNGKDVRNMNPVECGEVSVMSFNKLV